MIEEISSDIAVDFVLQFILLKGEVDPQNVDGVVICMCL